MEPDEPEPSRPDCELEADGRIWVTLGAAERLRGCNIPEGAILSISYQAERPKPRRAKRKEHHKMEPTTPEVTSAAPSASSTNTEAVVVQTSVEKDAVVAQVVDDIAKVEVPAETMAVVGQAVTPAFDPMAVAQANPMLALALAVLAVVGGGAGFKLWTKMSEQKHEQKLKEMELQGQAQGLNGAQPPPCQAKQAETDAKLAALEGRVAKAERTSLAMGDDFDPEDIQKRLVLLERAMKRIGVKPAAAGGSK